ncbi:MAG: bifunctional 4-hydroxy-2-oxoglutarate aldolase/2-dehydro-3-deoxy-phosphogluconate aldolase [Bacilli bacterium]|nr:bifunctional 4-hydroxy-2-oxoglutarate aldolase/2-dehydro-3-deoxy-phosphogluconate aldolase [Bacilli bacterium]
MLNGNKIVPVVVIKELNDTIPTLKGLNDGGINVAEITFRTACAKDAIKLGRETFPDMLIGAGTVLNVTQAKEAIEAGAKFIVSPGFDLETCNYLKTVNVPYIPGAVTPTEIMTCLSNGIEIIKFFPASCYGGVKTLKSLGGPFKSVKFLPTGGIDESNILEYLSLDSVVAIGGSFMMKGNIEENTRRVLDLINKGE